MPSMLLQIPSADRRIPLVFLLFNQVNGRDGSAYLRGALVYMALGVSTHSRDMVRVLRRRRLLEEIRFIDEKMSGNWRLVGKSC